MPKKSQPSLKTPLKKEKALKAIKSTKGSIARDVLVNHLSDLLQVNRVKDYCPNGLQVQGRASIKKIVTGVIKKLAVIQTPLTDTSNCWNI